MPYFNGSFTNSMVSDTSGGSEKSIFEQLPAILTATAQSVVGVVQAIRGKEVTPIGVRVGVDPETQRNLAIGGGAILLLLALFFFMRR